MAGRDRGKEYKLKFQVAAKGLAIARLEVKGNRATGAGVNYWAAEFLAARKGILD